MTNAIQTANTSQQHQATQRAGAVANYLIGAQSGSTLIGAQSGQPLTGAQS